MKMKTIEQIIEELNKEPNADQLCNLKIILAAHFSQLCTILEECLFEKTKVWEYFRSKCTSDTQAERAWQRTKEGIGETVTRLRMKKVEKLMSAISSKISVKQDEAKSLY
jgi:hypothetical protein